MALAETVTPGRHFKSNVRSRLIAQRNRAAAAAQQAQSLCELLDDAPRILREVQALSAASEVNIDTEVELTIKHTQNALRTLAPTRRALVERYVELTELGK